MHKKSNSKQHEIKFDERRGSLLFDFVELVNYRNNPDSLPWTFAAAPRAPCTFRTVLHTAEMSSCKYPTPTLASSRFSEISQAASSSRVTASSIFFTSCRTAMTSFAFDSPLSFRSPLENSLALRLPSPSSKMSH